MVYEKIVDMLVEKLDCDPADITPETRFADLGIDSLDVTELVMNVEEEFGVSLDMDASLTTVAQLVEKIEQSQAN